MAAYYGRRPTAAAIVHQVDGGLWQARCACRWHGRRRPARDAAQHDADEHEAACGLCIRHGRDYMTACTCMNCTRRRAVLDQERRRSIALAPALRPNVPIEEEAPCRSAAHAPETS